MKSLTLRMLSRHCCSSIISKINNITGHRLLMICCLGLAFMLVVGPLPSNTAVADDYYPDDTDLYTDGEEFPDDVDYDEEFPDDDYDNEEFPDDIDYDGEFPDDDYDNEEFPDDIDYDEEFPADDCDNEEFPDDIDYDEEFPADDGFSENPDWKCRCQCVIFGSGEFPEWLTKRQSTLEFHWFLYAPDDENTDCEVEYEGDPCNGYDENGFSDSGEYYACVLKDINAD